MSISAELLVHVFSFLDKRDLVQCCKISKEWQEIASDNSLWKRFFPGAEIPQLYGVTLKDHLYMVAKMFPAEKFPDIWKKITQPAPSQKVGFDEAKTSFIDELSKDGSVTVDTDQVFSELECDAYCPPEEPAKRGRCTIL